MILMNLKLDNILCFNKFHINFSYPKKIVGSPLDDEFLKERENFRYKKLNIIMGANATGKTALGRVLAELSNYSVAGSALQLSQMIYDKSRPCYIEIDYVNDDYSLVRVCNEVQELSSGGVMYKQSSSAFSCPIRSSDSYESCARQFSDNDEINNLFDFESVVRELSNSKAADYSNDKVKDDFVSNMPMFSSIIDSEFKPRVTDLIGKEKDSFLKVLKAVLITLDPAIEDVVESNELDYSFIIKKGKDQIIIQKGELLSKEKLSTGTVDGIAVALALANIILKKSSIYYIDEMFSYVQSDIEKRILAMMIYHLGNDRQLFFTTHNTDVLDMSLPKHSYLFLRKKQFEGKSFISPISADEIIKNKNSSLRNAVENDVFSSLPDDSLLDQLDDVFLEQD